MRAADDEGKVDWGKAKRVVDDAGRRDDGSWDWGQGLKTLAGAVKGFLAEHADRAADVPAGGAGGDFDQDRPPRRPRKKRSVSSPPDEL